MPRMTDELKAYQVATVAMEEAKARLHDAAVALAARVARESEPTKRRGRKPGPKPKTARRALPEEKPIDLKAARAKRSAS